MIEDGAAELSCLLNCLRVSLSMFSCSCLILFMMLLTLWMGGVHLVWRWCRLCPINFVVFGEHRMLARFEKDLMTLSL